MPDAREPRTVLEAAEQAAGGGDYVSAERLLRKAAELQEKSLGPLHPDLANTLNNLGIVCEITDKPDDAEQFFRRASAIAKTALPADHPFVATSRKNLEDFCKAKGKKVDKDVDPPPAPPLLEDLIDIKAKPLPELPAPAAKLAPPRVSESAAARVPEIPPARPAVEVPTPFEVSSPPRSRAGFLIACALIAGFVATALLLWLLLSDKSQPTADVAKDPVASAPAKTQPAAPVAPRSERVPPARPEPAPAGAPKPAPAAPATTPPRAKSSSSPALVAGAQLCRTLSTGGNWQCAPPGDPVSPGPLVFFTRIKSPVNTTVLHRWYRGNRLVRSSELRILANPSEGYRTYSRNTVDAQGGGEWRVELRTSDGALLHEERFVVR